MPRPHLNPCVAGLERAAWVADGMLTNRLRLCPHRDQENPEDETMVRP